MSRIKAYLEHRAEQETAYSDFIDHLVSGLQEFDEQPDFNPTEEQEYQDDQQA